jgi:aspartate/methionine/tyrosine aminotransferase
MLPNYLQTWGLSRAYAGRADAFWLVESRSNGKARWALDLASLKKAVGKKTRLVIVTNPNNPTGGVLSEEEMDEIIRAARRANAWILADEIYRGAELSGKISPSFWGRYDKLLITNGLSKAFGLPGLRIGWIIGPPQMVAKLWSYRDYTTIAPGMVSDYLARIVMDPLRREQVLERTRSILRKQLPRLEGWIHTHDDIFSYIPPLAGAIAYISYRLPISSAALMNKLMKEKSVLLAPGDHFGMGRYLRIGYGYDIEHTLRALARVDETLAELQQQKPGRSERAQAIRSGAA